MKITHRLLILCFTLFTFCNSNAQKDSQLVPKLSFDCAKSDNSISVTDLKSCKKIILSGAAHYEDYKIITAIVSIKPDGKTKEFTLSDNTLSDELVSSIIQLTKGSEIHVDNIKIQNVKDIKIIKNLPAATFIVK